MNKLIEYQTCIYYLWSNSLFLNLNVVCSSVMQFDLFEQHDLEVLM